MRKKYDSFSFSFFQNHGFTQPPQLNVTTILPVLNPVVFSGNFTKKEGTLTTNCCFELRVPLP
jgi:hypothetical protein